MKNTTHKKKNKEKHHFFFIIIFFYQTGPLKVFSLCDTVNHDTNAIFEWRLEPVLTIVHAKYDCRTKKGTDCLTQEIYGKLPPALPSKQTERKSDRGIQVAACKREGISVNIKSK